MELPDETVADLLRLSGVALAHERLIDALAEICEIAERAVRHADGASMTMIAAAGPIAVASSNAWAEHLDETQHEEHEGPCVDAARTGVIFRVRDVAAEARWPSYMPRAREQGAASMMSLPMTAETKTIGAINIYSRSADAFGAGEVSIAEIVSGHASLATQVAATLSSQRAVADQLRVAVGSRSTIEQAKGIVIAALGCDEDTAFDHLVQRSQRENRKLRDIADEMVREQRSPGRRP